MCVNLHRDNPDAHDLEGIASRAGGPKLRDI